MNNRTLPEDFTDDILNLIDKIEALERSVEALFHAKSDDTLVPTAGIIELSTADCITDDQIA